MAVVEALKHGAAEGQAMSTRREFLHETTYGALTALTAMSGVARAGAATRSDTGFADETISPSDLDSDIGSLYPFVKSQAVAGEFPLSFLQK